MEQTSVRVVTAADCGPDAVAIEFETPAEFEAAPGQFVRLTALVEAEEISRFYTISSANVEETFQITVGYDPVDGGPFSEYLLALDEGSQVEIAGPYGDTYHEGEPEVVILAGGPGIGPAVGIAERVLARDGVAAVVYQDERPIHQARLEALAAAGVRVELVEAPRRSPAWSTTCSMLTPKHSCSSTGSLSFWISLVRPSRARAVISRARRSKTSASRRPLALSCPPGDQLGSAGSTSSWPSASRRLARRYRARYRLAPSRRSASRISSSSSSATASINRSSCAFSLGVSVSW